MSTIYKSKDGEAIFVTCNCGSCEHQFRLWYDTEDDLYLMNIHLTTWENILRRIIVAVKYIFGYKSRWGEWDDIIIDRDSAKEIVEFLQRYPANE